MDDTELNSDIKIRFALDETGLNEKMHSCISSEDSIQCIETKNEDKIWIQVYIVVVAVFQSWVIHIDKAIFDAKNMWEVGCITKLLFTDAQ